jgi:hypothetical protein
MTGGKLNWIEARCQAWESTMRFLKTIAVLIVLAGTLTSSAQAPEPLTAPLEHGPLTIWMVRPGTRGEKLRITAQKIQAQVQATQVLPTTVQEQTAGSFGQPSSNVGQTAGSYGQTSGSSGRNASDTGQTASTYGTTAGSFGTEASNHGQTAGSAGQTAGTFGQTSSTYGQTLGGSSLSQASAAPVSAAANNRTRDELAVSTEHTFPGLELRTVDVIAEELQDKLAAVKGSADYPDVLLADPGLGSYSGPGLTMLGWTSFFDATDDPRISPRWRDMRPTILTHAPHLARAQAFVVWLRDAGLCQPCEGKVGDKDVAAAASAAASALQSVLQGDSLGARADADAAHFSPRLAQYLALMAGAPDVPGDLKFRIDVMSAWARDRLAVITLRGIASSPSAFGVVHSLVVLRKDDAGRWKVLHISPNMAPGSLFNGLGDLEQSASGPAKGDKPPHVVAISQAAPPDDDNRPPKPDLWWDNSGDARLLVVEWQFNADGAWTDSRLMMVPNGGNRTQTRVPAQFAAIDGGYRWRVWSVGAGGAIALSPWRRLNILP